MTVHPLMTRAIFSNAPAPCLQVSNKKSLQIALLFHLAAGCIDSRTCTLHCVSSAIRNALGPICWQIFNLCMWVSIQCLKLPSFLFSLYIHPCTIHLMYKETQQKTK